MVDSRDMNGYYYGGHTALMRMRSEVKWRNA